MEQLRQRRRDAARQRNNPAPVPAPASVAQPADTQEPDPSSIVPATEEADPSTGAAPQSQDEEQTAQPEEDDSDAPLSSGLPPEIELAIAEAIAEPDKAKLTKKLVKRIHQLVGQRDQAAAELAQARQGKPEKPETTPQPTANPSVDPRLAPFDSRIGNLENALRTLEANPDGLTMPGEGGENLTLDAAEVAELRRKYTKDYVDTVAKRAAAETQVTQEHQTRVRASWDQAATVYPWISQQKSPEFQLAVSELKQLGPAARAALQADPAFPLVVARYVAGFQAESAAGKTASALPAPMRKPVTTSRKPTAVVTAPTTVASKRTAGNQASQEAEEQFQKTGSFNDLLKWRKSMAANAA